MRSGTPLTDADRLPWLSRIAQEIDAWRRRGESGVVTCSALKRTYRDILIGADTLRVIDLPLQHPRDHNRAA